MILDDYRDELDLEFRWLNPPPPEMKKKWKIYEQMKRKSQNYTPEPGDFNIKSREDEQYFVTKKDKRNEDN